MDDIVPGALQRLREADIIGLAGLAAASLGQEYCRIGSVSATKRQGARLSGAVEVPAVSAEPITRPLPVEQPASENDLPETLSALAQRFEVEVEVMSRGSCQAVCTCGNQATLLCSHAAALLYQWIHHPYAFVPFFQAPEENTALPARTAQLPVGALKEEPSTASTQLPSKHAPLQTRGLPVNTVGETLAQFGLSELRAVAREYGISVAGLGKQQLMETTIEVLSQPEAVRRVVGSLTKAQRQLLAAFALAGGSMSDEDLRSLFERFSLDSAGTLQDMLVTLQAKLLLVRTSLNHSLQQRLNLSLSPLDISWYIPQEIRDALHVALPVTPFDVNVPYGKGGSASPLLRL
ncbi:MAG TPA: Rho termination factor N-terminal domain-containing protein, partial [Ktedonobacteraceae bacterium]|nr:Rho termination factor N-terminal domain-containing protein [Ktedonobacteraceae bacterium]